MHTSCEGERSDFLVLTEKMKIVSPGSITMRSRALPLSHWRPFRSVFQRPHTLRRLVSPFVATLASPRCRHDPEPLELARCPAVPHVASGANLVDERRDH